MGCLELSAIVQLISLVLFLLLLLVTDVLICLLTSFSNLARKLFANHHEQLKNVLRYDTAHAIPARSGAVSFALDKRAELQARNSLSLKDLQDMGISSRDCHVYR